MRSTNIDSTERACNLARALDCFDEADRAMRECGYQESDELLADLHRLRDNARAEFKINYVTQPS